MKGEDSVAKTEATHPLAEFGRYKGDWPDDGETSDEREGAHDLLVGEDAMVEETAREE